MNPDFNKVERIGLIDLNRGELSENFTILNTNLLLAIIQNKKNYFGVGGGVLLGYGTVTSRALRGSATISSKELHVKRKQIELTSYLQHRAFDWGYEINLHYQRKIAEKLWLGAQWISGELWESVNTYHKLNISLGIDF